MIGSMKARLLADDWDGAERDAQWTLDERAAKAESPIGRYAACLALLVLGRWREARVLADGLRTHEGFPTDVADAIAFIAAEDIAGYTVAIESVLQSFETRTEYLEDDRVDLSAWAHDAIALALPDKILCRPDCAGLCPVCGKDLNVEPHEHVEERTDPRWAVLNQLREE